MVLIYGSGCQSKVKAMQQKGKDAGYEVMKVIFFLLVGDWLLENVMQLYCNCHLIA